MSQNLLKRIITSIILLSLLFFINFSHKYIFILSILTLGMIICIESNRLFSKLLITKKTKNSFLHRYEGKFLLLNIITFFYIFFNAFKISNFDP